MRFARPVIATLAASAAVLGSASGAQAAGGVVKYDTDLVLIPAPPIPNVPQTVCPRAASVYVNGVRVATPVSPSTGYGTCAVRGSAAVSYRPGTTVLVMVTGTGAWPAFSFRQVTTAPVATS